MLVRQGANDVLNFNSPALQRFKQLKPRWQVVQDSFYDESLTSFDLVAQLADGNYIRALAKTAEYAGFDRDRVDRVGKPVGDSLAKQPGVRQLDASLFQRYEMACQ